MENTDKYRKSPKHFPREEHDIAVKANLLEFLNELFVIDLDLWEELHMPLESQKMDFIQLRGLIKGTL